MSRPKKTAAAAKPPRPPASPRDQERPPCPECGEPQAERLHTHTAAGWNWTRYRCKAPGCARVWIHKTPDEPDPAA